MTSWLAACFRLPGVTSCKAPARSCLMFSDGFICIAAAGRELVLPAQVVPLAAGCRPSPAAKGLEEPSEG